MTARTNYLKILYDLNHDLNSALALEEVLDRVCRQAAKIFKVPQVVVFLLDSDGQSAKIVAEKRARGLPSQLGTIHRLAEHPVTAKIIRKKWTLEVPDVATTRRLSKESRGALLMLGITSLLGVPILSQGEAVGILFLDRLGAKAPFNLDEVKLAQLIAGEVGDVVRRGQLFAKVEDLNARLRQFSEQAWGKEVVEQGLKKPKSLELKEVHKVVAFVDIRGFTSFTETHPPEQVAETIRTMYELCERATEHYGGQLNEVKGDEVLLLFDELDPALRSLLEIQEVVGKYLASVKLSVGIGVNEGEVLLGVFGTQKRKNYRLVGSLVNTVKGLERLAKNNEIFVPKEVYLKARDKFRFRLVGPLKVKGKVVETYCLLSSCSQE